MNSNCKSRLQNHFREIYHSTRCVGHLNLTHIIDKKIGFMELTKRDSWRIFNQIAHRYDPLNRILSFGMDLYWRRQVSNLIPKGSDLEILDLATGTADQLIDAMKRHKTNIKQATGLDPSLGMLDIAQKKVAPYEFSSRVKLQEGSAASLPVPSHSVNAITMSFGIRNVPGVTDALCEMFRVLKPGGRALILEFSTPTNKLFRKLYFFYLRNILPYIGGWLSGDYKAYRYLNQTIEEFPSGNDFLALMRKAKFEKVSYRTMTFGIVSIYIGDK
jgi:demethylmenaquinone methyltransferase / 2-methoxy-6-polyprenyl-1,4-benzoquinol methylase